MALQDRKRAMTLACRIAKNGIALRAVQADLNAVKALYDAAVPAIVVANTALAGNLAAINMLLININTAANSVIIDTMIAACSTTHGGNAI